QSPVPPRDGHEPVVGAPPGVLHGRLDRPDQRADRRSGPGGAPVPGPRPGDRRPAADRPPREVRGARLLLSRRGPPGGSWGKVGGAMTGYGGRVLCVDLTSGASDVRPLDDVTARAFLGGNGLAARLLWGAVPAGVDPFDPAN